MPPVARGFGFIREAVELRRPAAAERAQLREHEPHPVAGLAAGAELAPDRRPDRFLRRDEAIESGRAGVRHGPTIAPLDMQANTCIMTSTLSPLRGASSWTSCTESASSRRPTRSIAPSPPATAWPPGGPTGPGRRPGRRPVPVPLRRRRRRHRRLRHEGARAAARPAGAVAGGRRPRRVDRHPHQLGHPPGRRVRHRHVPAPGLARAGGVHAPLQHQVGDLPDEPEGPGRDRQGPPNPADVKIDNWN